VAETKKLSAEILDAGKKLTSCFIDHFDPPDRVPFGQMMRISGVALDSGAKLTALSLHDSHGASIAAKVVLGVASPGMGAMHPAIAHAGNSRFWIEGVPADHFARPCTIRARFGDGPPQAIARLTATDIIALITDDQRLPTKRSALRFLRQNGLDVGTILDVGVQHQTKDLMAAFPDRKHLLFEPVEEAYPYIEKNYSSFDYELVKAAVSDKDDQAKLEIRTRNENSPYFTSTVVTERGAAHGSGMITTKTRTIKTITLDSFLAGKPFKTPYLLKLDVDGNEMDILRGASETLKKTSCVIIEVALTNLFMRGQYLIDKGLTLWDIVDLGYYRDNLYHADLIFLSKEEKARAPFSPWQKLPFDGTKITTFLH